jgi:secreted trypsin-like serine protease
MKKLILILWMFLAAPNLWAFEVESSGLYPAAPQIIGGYDATPGAWPWMTAIVYADYKHDLFLDQFCGGALIAANWVLTAGHCVDGLVAADIQVAVGAHDLETFSGPRIQVKKIVRHPNYVNFKANDLALLELSVPSGQQPVILFSGASRQGIGVNLVSRMTTLTGWGLADTPTTWYYPSILQQVDLPVVADANCNDTFGETLLSSQLCAGYPIAKDACTGDSGDPMMLLIDGQWTHVGIVSYGADCQQSEGIYGVYTRSSAFVDFIRQNVPAAQFTETASQALPWLMLLLR